MGLDISPQKLGFSTKNRPINVDGYVYKIADLDNTYFNHSFIAWQNKESDYNFGH